MRLLLTGFEPFGEETVNPSAEIMRALASDPPRDVELTTLELPVRGRVSFELLVPALESSRQSNRRDVGRAELEAMSLPAATVLGTVVCDLVGAPTEDPPPGRLPVAWWLTPAEDVVKAETANQLEWNTYAGAVVVLLALVGVVAMPRRALVPGALLLGVLGFAQGWPGVRWLYLVPGLNVGEPGRALGLAWALERLAGPWLA